VIWYNISAMGKYIISTPSIMGGAPVITGTRIPIAVILHRLKEGNALPAIHDMYPWVDQQTLEHAIDEAIRVISTPSNAKNVL